MGAPVREFDASGHDGPLSGPAVDPAEAAEATATGRDHEVLEVFDRSGFRLNSVLYEMLNEHHCHRTERRGSGYTQASRHLAVHLNLPRHPYEFDEVRLFAERDTAHAPALVGCAARRGIALAWRNVDQAAASPEIAADDELESLYTREAQRQRRLRCIPSAMQLEESRLLAQLVVDLVLPIAHRPGVVELRAWPDTLPIGTCPLAEKYFLELADGFVRRGGRMNVIVSSAGQPLLLEKLGLGDDHSCISVAPLLLNGVHLPPGSLLGTAYDDSVPRQPNRELPGHVIPVERCAFRFLRLTTLAVSPAARQRAFTTHFEAQVRGGLFSPGSVTIDDLDRIALRQVASCSR